MRPRRALPILSPPPWPMGYGLTRLGTVTSTMDEAAAATMALSENSWVFARQQTGGRGRQGKEWQSPEGNFKASLALRVRCPAPEAALRSFATSLALYDTLRGLGVPEADLALKWPNDVLYRGGKLAGILLESQSLPGSSDVEWLIIGVGVNLVEAPPAEPGAAFTPVALAPEHRVAPETFLDHLAPAFADWEGRFKSAGFAPLRDPWLKRAARLGQVITARRGDLSQTGQFETVDGAGNLILQTASGRVAIAAAEVYF